MISLTFSVDNISNVISMFDRIQIRKYLGTGTPTTPVTDTLAALDYTAVSGTDVVSGRTGVDDVLLDASYSQYYFTEPDGAADDWYISRYYDLASQSATGWSDPVLGEPGDLFYNPVFPPEIEYGSSDQLIIDRIRRLMGDPLGLRREYGEEAESSIHPDNRTYEFDEKGWPVSINMGGHQYWDIDNPSINGYRFLRFATTISGIDSIAGVNVDIWYYTFRHSDRQIMEAYDNCPPPPGLTTTTANSEAYMLQTAIDLLTQEVWEDSGEDGAVISDEGSRYDPSPGLRMREGLIDKLQKRLDRVIKSLVLTGIGGVLLD